jgi:hypothetical protein
MQIKIPLKKIKAKSEAFALSLLCIVTPSLLGHAVGQKLENFNRGDKVQVTSNPNLKYIYLGPCVKTKDVGVLLLDKNIIVKRAETQEQAVQLVKNFRQDHPKPFGLNYSIQALYFPESITPQNEPDQVELSNDVDDWPMILPHPDWFKAYVNGKLKEVFGGSSTGSDKDNITIQGDQAVTSLAKFRIDCAQGPIESDQFSPGAVRPMFFVFKSGPHAPAIWEKVS